MFWRKKRKYDVLVPPLYKNINQLSKAETQAYFDWYISKLDERIEYLRSFTKLDLDYSPESLIRLWAWFLCSAEIEVTPKEQLQKLKEKLIADKSPLVDAILARNAKRFTFETECIMRDIGMYWGALFVKNHPTIYWGFYTKPKNDIFVNCPVLLGFPNEIYPSKKGPPFEPSHMVGVQANKLYRGAASKRDLYIIHKIWEDKILNADTDE